MALYTYKAMNAKGRVLAGRLDAINPVDLEMRLKRMELDLITGKPVKQHGLFSSHMIPRRELINFCFHLGLLTQAGVPIIESLIDLRNSIDSMRFQEVIASLIENIEGGSTLSQAMAKHPKVFDTVFTSLIRAGEDSGDLPSILKTLNDALKWQDELAAQTHKLIMYPAFLGLIVLAVFFFMMVYLVPKMVGFIKNMGQEIPLTTKILLSTSEFITHYWHLVLLLPLMAVAVSVALIRRNPAIQFRFDALKLSTPMLGGILKKIILSRFASVFAMMYSSGISILDSLRTTEDVAGNLVIKEGLRKAGQQIADGKNLTAAFQETGLFPPLVIRMLKVGEGTGALDTALVNVCYFYNRDVRESIARGQTLIEPALTVFVGLLLGWVMLSILGPIYDTISRLRI